MVFPQTANERIKEKTSQGDLAIHRSGDAKMISIVCLRANFNLTVENHPTYLIYVFFSYYHMLHDAIDICILFVIGGGVLSLRAYVLCVTRYYYITMQIYYQVNSRRGSKFSSLCDKDYTCSLPYSSLYSVNGVLENALG